MRNVFKIEDGRLGITLTDPWAPVGTLTDVCSATSAEFADSDLSCQVIAASLDTAVTVNRSTVPATYCADESSTVSGVVEEQTISGSILLDENEAQGVAAFLYEHSGEEAWVYIGGDGDDPPKAVARVRLASPSLFGTAREVRQATFSFGVDGRAAGCFGDAASSYPVGNPEVYDLSSVYPGAAALADLSTLKADSTYGDTGTAAPYNGGTGTEAAFASGQYITLADASQAHWTGTAWAAGPAT